MEKLTDPNPYEILGITPDADRETIKRALAEKQRQSKTQLERQRALHARQTLSSIQKRLIVDAFMPDFLEEGRESEILAELEDVEDFDWRDIVDPDEILKHDLQALMLATLKFNMENIPKPEKKIILLSEFDGLDEFIEEWLNSDD